MSHIKVVTIPDREPRKLLDVAKTIDDGLAHLCEPSLEVLVEHTSLLV